MENDVFELHNKFFNEVFKKYFNKAERGRIGGIYSAEERGPHLNADLEPRMINSILFNTPFQPRIANSFIHFTTAERLLTILKEKCIMMYSLDSMNDPSESRHFMSKNVLNKSKSDSYKNSIWCFSFCAAKVETNQASLHMWREYSDLGRGCAIRFHFEPGIAYPYFRYFISNVSYDQKSVHFTHFVRDCNDFFEAHKINISNFDRLLAFLSPLFKNKIFAYEKEVRLLFIPDLPNPDFNLRYGNSEKKQNEFEIFPDFKNNKFASYHKLFLDNPRILKVMEARAIFLSKGKGNMSVCKNDTIKSIMNSMQKLTPRIEIDSIIFGPSFPNELKYDFELATKDLFNDCIGRVPKFTNSVLTDVFQ